ncbi:hypothetical protein C8J57DRAFT_1247873 [Mycena rebaudengoi]|nr:hypothetical protein C8J57DRAFT_1247873 [Mycena rebaudengoi]
MATLDRDNVDARRAHEEERANIQQQLAQREGEFLTLKKGLVAEGKPRQWPKQERKGTSQLDPQANAHGNSVLAPTSEMDARVREQIRVDGGGSVDSMAGSVRREEVHELLATREVEIARHKGDIVAINRRNGDARRIVEEDQAKMQQQLARLESKVSKLKKALDDERKVEAASQIGSFGLSAGSLVIERKDAGALLATNRRENGEGRTGGMKAVGRPTVFCCAKNGAGKGVSRNVTPRRFRGRLEETRKGNRGGLKVGSRGPSRTAYKQATKSQSGGNVNGGGMDTTLRDDLMAEIDKQVVRGESANPSLNNESTQSKASGWHDDTDETEERQARLLAPSLRARQRWSRNFLGLKWPKTAPLLRFLSITYSLLGAPLFWHQASLFRSKGDFGRIGMKILDTCFQESQLACDRSSDRPILALSPRMREMGQSNVADVFLRLASWALALSPCAGVSVGQHPPPARTSAKDARLLGDAGVYECSGIGAIRACIHTVMWYQANGWYPFRVLFSSLCVPECREANDHRICQPGPWTRAFTGYPRSTWAAEDVLDFKLGFSEMIRREIFGLYWAKMACRAIGFWSILLMVWLMLN